MNRCYSVSSINRPSRKAPPAPMRCATRSTWRVSATNSGIRALLGGRASWHSHARMREPGGDDRCDRFDHPAGYGSGSGGVMLPHYSPLKVAETFSILSALFPGRVDLGIGRAPGTDHATAFALQRDRRQPAPDDFPHQLGELLGYLENRLPAGHPFAALSALPGRPYMPDVWLLGSSPQSALWAADTGLPYVFRRFHQSGRRDVCGAIIGTGSARPRPWPSRIHDGGQLGDLRRDR